MEIEITTLRLLLAPVGKFFAFMARTVARTAKAVQVPGVLADATASRQARQAAARGAGSASGTAGIAWSAVWKSTFRAMIRSSSASISLSISARNPSMTRPVAET